MNTLKEIDKKYREKRIKIKKEKRELEKVNFRSGKERKKAKDGIKREYRSYKRSEKQAIDKFIQQEIDSSE